MFDRLTDDAKKVLGFARDETVRLRHDHIGTEHVVLGLLKEGRNGAARGLAALGVEPSAVRAEIERRAPPGTGPAPTGQLPFTAATKRVLEAAHEEAKAAGGQRIGPEHLLLATFADWDGVACHSLRALHVDLDALAARLRSGDAPRA